MSDASNKGPARHELPFPFDRSLCASCAHVRIVAGARESVFLLCRRAESDPRFPKYPPQPVLRCTGHMEQGSG